MTELNEQARLRQILEFCLDKDLERILLTNPVDASTFSKTKIRPLLLKGELIFQAEEQRGKQAFHKNLNRDLRICTIIKIVGQDQRIFRDSCLQFIGQRRFAGARSSRNANHKRRTVQSLIPPQSKISCKRRLGT